MKILKRLTEHTEQVINILDLNGFYLFLKGQITN